MVPPSLEKALDQLIGEAATLCCVFPSWPLDQIGSTRSDTSRWKSAPKGV